MSTRNARKVLRGTVSSNKMDKTVVVMVSFDLRHPKFGKVVERRKKFYAHCDDESIEIGDSVEIMETRPISKMKRWRVTQKLEA